ncbi:FAD-dependent oxidoreductase [Actinomycetospora sp. TBRC 11914]|uniref:FAD-dependent oxidoreductase n=1 Tax=Actinomycetospora sp. TBRC 11914 TaxID=2729387 RepID=UPI00145F237D|nr:FAD-dependent oxidoreductase [Actinomycetospora sp. TBRC 11914]NMO92087.1 FAD-dependent oxidoreductase [Actinomycetospora sp. TBRC 11914]
MAGRLVVLGGGAAGMSAASAARRTDPGLEVVVLEATGYAAAGLCGLPYHLAGLVGAAEDLVAYPPSFFRERRGIDLRLGTEVVGVDTDRRLVLHREGPPLGYTALVVATGGRPTTIPLPRPADRPGFVVRTVEDLVDLRALVDAGGVRRALVVGAGYIGLETAEALAGRGVAVTVAERLDRVLPTTLDPEVAAVVEEHVRTHVDLRLGTDAVPLAADEGVDVVVTCTGVGPAADLLAGAGARTGPGGALLVDDRMRTSLPGVWAAGDCIAPYHRVLGAPAFVPLGPTANKTGRVAGTVAAGGDARFAGIVGTAVVKVFDLEVARTGLTLAEARAAGFAAVAADVVSRSRAKYYPGVSPVHVRVVHEPGGRLLGAQLVGREGAAKRVDVVATALHAGLSVDDLADLDLSYAPPYAPVYDPVLVAAQAAQRVTASAG